MKAHTKAQAAMLTRLAGRVDKAIHRRRLTLREVEDITGVAQATIHRVRHATANPSYVTAMELLKLEEG